MVFFSKTNVTKHYLFILIFHICANFQTTKKNFSWVIYLNVFNHIVAFWKKRHNFLCMMGAIIIFGENISYLVLWLWIGDKVSWVGCTFEELANKTKCQKMNVNVLQPNWDESFDLGDRRQNTLKLLYFIMILNTISMP